VRKGLLQSPSIGGQPEIPSERHAFMSHKQQYEGAELEYEREDFRSVERFEHSQQRRPSMGRKRGKTPQSFNGIHRRRRRKMNW
jgi:hypothetical protein